MAEEASKEGISEVTPTSESNKEQLYGTIILKEARLLLAKYLPEALPQEPTEILFDIQALYLGKFRGKHYIAIEDPADYDLEIALKGDIKQVEESGKAREKENEEVMKLWKLFENSEINYEELVKKQGELQEASDQRSKELQNTKLEPQDWQEPERLFAGQDRYSTYTWREIYVLVHELIHQRQAELNPEAFPQLSLPELNNIDPDNTPKGELKRELTKAHNVHIRTMDDNSLFYPVVEGMGVVGTFYVMGNFLDDLVKSGQAEVTEKVREIRSEAIHLETKERAGNADPYNSHYIEGVGIMRKLYKHFGIENTPKLLTQVDLQACQGITKDSAQYQQMMENPTLLLGLQKVV